MPAIQHLQLAQHGPGDCCGIIAGYSGSTVSLLPARMLHRAQAVRQEEATFTGTEEALVPVNSLGTEEPRRGLKSLMHAS